MDDGAVIDFIDFGNGTNVAGAEEISFLCVLALENEWPRRFDSTLIVVDVNYIVLLECALMHTEDADFANEGVVDDFEDLSNERQILIWVGFEWRAIAFDEQRIICLCRTRQMANDYFMKSRIPISFFAEQKQTGMTCPSRNALVTSGWRARGSMLPSSR